MTASALIDKPRLFRAYGKAKREMGLLPGYAARFAAFEQDLERNLSRLLTRTEDGQWFDKIAPGLPRIWPKRATTDRSTKIAVHVGDDAARTIDRLTIRIGIQATVEFAIMETIWLETFGLAVESLLSRACLSNRLKAIQKPNNQREPAERRLYEPYSIGFRAFRQAPIRTAIRTLKNGTPCVLVATDIKSFYDRIDPRFLLSDAFINRVVQSARRSYASFNRAQFKTATRSLLCAYRRFWAASKYWVPISNESIGIPTGCLTAPLIASAALAQLDEYLSTRATHHWRYVDDFVLLSTNAEHQTLSPVDLLRALFPTAGVRHDQDDTFAIELDSRRLGVNGSKLELVSTKTKVFFLRGTAGREYLRLVASDLSKVQSERRWLLAMDKETLAGAGVKVADGGEPPIHTLREADQIQLERFSSSLALARLADVIGLLDNGERITLLRDRLRHLSRVAKDPVAWTELTTAVYGMLMLCLVAGAEVEASRITHDLLDSWARVTPSKTTLLWNDLPMRNQRAYRLLLVSLKQQLIDSIYRSGRPELPWTAQLCDAVYAGGGRGFGQVARRIAVADLAYLRPQLDSRARENVWNAISIPKAVQRCAQMLPAALRDNIQRALRILAPDFYPADGVKLAAVYLMTRPPEYHDVALDCVKEGIPPDRVHSVVNALRGTRYSDSGARPALHHQGSDELGVDAVITDFEKWQNSMRSPRTAERILALIFKVGAGDPLPDPLFIVGNVPTDEKYAGLAAQGSPSLTAERFERISHVFDDAIERRRRHRGPALLVLPELAVPRSLAPLLVSRAVRNDLGLLMGLEYLQVGNKLVNEALLVAPTTVGRVAPFSWSKRFPADIEGIELHRMKTSIVAAPWTGGRRLVVRTPYGDITTLICSELLEPQLMSQVFGRANVVLVPAWNKDVASFEHLARASALRLHAFVCVANNATYSDCRIVGPHKERWAQDVARLVERDASTCVSAVLPLSLLIDFHTEARKNGPHTCADNKFWKPIPPGFCYPETPSPPETD